MKRLAKKIISKIKMNIQLFKSIDTVKCTTNRFSFYNILAMQFFVSPTVDQHHIRNERRQIKLIRFKLLLNFYGNFCVKFAVHNFKNKSMQNIWRHRNLISHDFI